MNISITNSNINKRLVKLNKIKKNPIDPILDVETFLCKKR